MDREELIAEINKKFYGQPRQEKIAAIKRKILSLMKEESPNINSIEDLSYFLDSILSLLNRAKLLSNKHITAIEFFNRRRKFFRDKNAYKPSMMSLSYMRANGTIAFNITDGALLEEFSRFSSNLDTGNNFRINNGKFILRPGVFTNLSEALLGRDIEKDIMLAKIANKKLSRTKFFDANRKDNTITEDEMDGSSGSNGNL